MKYVEWVGRYIGYSGLKIRVEQFIKIAYSLPLLFIPISILLYIIVGFFYCLLILSVLIILEFVLHISLVSLSNKRVSVTEEMLPDALRLVSSNLRAGIILEKAFIESARPEFGPLSEQIKEAGKSLMLGKQTKEAFKKIPEKINSPLLRRTVELISDGITKGGNLAPLLDGISDDIKSSLMLRKDIKAQVASYSMFILLALGIGAPLLYASSLFLMETMIGLGGILPTETLQTQAISLSFSGINLSKDFLLNYSLLLMSLSSILGGILIGLIKEGKEIAGLKYVPIVLILDFVIFYLIKFVFLASFAVF